jgi:hypothetical protein
MSDDIVTRLRDGDPHCRDGHIYQAWANEAADKIEWLLEWKELAYQMRNKYWWFMRAKTLKKFDQMHKEDWKRNGL